MEFHSESNNILFILKIEFISIKFSSTNEKNFYTFSNSFILRKFIKRNQSLYVKNNFVCLEIRRFSVYSQFSIFFEFICDLWLIRT